MNEWIIYTKNGCNFCLKAKNLLNHYNIPFTIIEINDTNKETIYKQLDKHTNKYRYFPIIFFKKQFIGGYTELEKYIQTYIKSCKNNHIFDSKNQKCIKNKSKRAKNLLKARKINHIIIPTPLIYNKQIEYKGSPYYSLLFMLYLQKKHKEHIILIPNKLSNLNRNISHEDISLRWNQLEHTITVPPLFWEYLKQYTKQDKKYIVFPFGFSCDSNNGHANYIIYDNYKKTLERFEPYGPTITDCIYKNIDDEILNLFNKNMGKEFIIEYKKPLSIYKYKGFQTKQADEEQTMYEFVKKNGYNSKFSNGFDGFCTVWCIWYVELRLSNPNVNRKQLLYNTIFKLDVEGTSFTNFIYDYAQYLLNIIERPI